MEALDIIIIAILVFAVVRGWSKGIITQLAGITGIIAGFWAATYFTQLVTEMFHLEKLSHQTVYLITLIVVMALVILVLKFVDRLLKNAGLSFPIRILGVIFSVGKWVLLMSLLLSIYMSTVSVLKITPSETITRSIFFKPFKTIEEHIFPFIKSNASKYQEPKQITSI